MCSGWVKRGSHAEYECLSSGDISSPGGVVTDALRGFLQLGFFVGGCGLVMIFLQPPQSAEFVLSVCSAIMGFGVVAAAIFIGRQLRLPPE